MVRRQVQQRTRSRGFALMALLVMLTLGGLYFFVNNLTPEAVAVKRQQQTSDAMNLARDALLGYALKYREDQIANGNLNRVYGYLPLPDLGTTRNNQTTTPTLCNPSGVQLEGCDALTNTTNQTVIGRFPWRMLGTGPLKDGNGECLWYVVSGSHDRIQRPAPMNWDTLSHLDIVVANGATELAGALASAHDRPIAIIFSPGPALSSQSRAATSPATDDVTECGGNYDAKNYLDPIDGSSLGVTTNFFAGATNSASGATTELDAGLKKFSAQGLVQRDSATKLWPQNCAAGNCSVVGNDTGLMLSSDSFFPTLRNSSVFRLDINTMLDRITACLRDKIAGGSTPTLLALTGVTSPTDKNIGRIPSDSCYDDTTNPLGYFSNYQNQILVATKISSNFNVVVDGAESSCAAVLLFAGQRTSTQLRTSTEVNGIQQLNTPSNYLEGNNLSCFTTTNSDCFTSGATTRFVGPGTFFRIGADKTKSSDVDRCTNIDLSWKFTDSTCQTREQDVVQCVPTTASITPVAPPVAVLGGGTISLASYAPSSQKLALGSAPSGTNAGSVAASLSACAWSSDTHSSGSGFRSYFRFRILRVQEGFVFALIDSDRNASTDVIDINGNRTATVCGGARQHLGYSGNNGIAPYIEPPKIGLEFDTSRNINYSPTGTGRNDPASPVSSHVAIVYWGAAVANATVTDPRHDDNVHGFPTTTESGARPSPMNPAAVSYPRLSDLGFGSGIDASQREFHARVEMTRSYNSPSDPKDGAATITTKLWLEPVEAKMISTMTYTSGSPPTLAVTISPPSGTTSGHGLLTGDTVVIQGALRTGYNGEYIITEVDKFSFTAQFPAGTSDPGRYIRSITWKDSSTSPVTVTDLATVTSPTHGLSNGNAVKIAGAIPTEFNGTWTVSNVTTDTYTFDRQLSYQPGTMFAGIAAIKALTPRAIALSSTTRAMSQLDPSFPADVTGTATIYDEQKSACSVSAPLCPAGQSCGSDNMCYRPSFQNLRLGFTVGERLATGVASSRSALIEITNQATTWLP